MLSAKLVICSSYTNVPNKLVEEHDPTAGITKIVKHSIFEHAMHYA
jgi:hypothetical protein